MVSDKEAAKPEDSKTEDVVLERILSKFKPLGPYYLRLMPLLIFSSMTNSLYCMNYVFAALSVDYRCNYPECEDQNISGEFFNMTNQNGKCYRFSPVNDSGICSFDNNETNLIHCNDWVYAEPSSFVADFGLACQDWKRTLVGTVHSFGYMIGLLLLGPISDKIGRKKLIIFSGVTCALMGLARSIAVSYWAYIAFELIEALLGDTYSPTFMLGVEMVSKENRVLFSPLMIGSMSIGGMIMAFIAWAIPYWRTFLRVIYAPSLIFIFYALFLDESVRWLLIKGRKDEAKEILKKAADISNVYLDDETLDSVKCEKNESKANLITLLKMTITSKTLLLRFLACACMWITATFNKYGLLINSVSLEGNKYVNYALTASADLPASITLVFILIKFKRKKPLICSFLMTGMFCVVQSFIPKGYTLLSTSLFLLGKYTSAIAYATVYLYTSELFPTYTRNTMHALCSSIGRIGSILAPQTPLLMRYWSGFPSVIIGILSLTTGVIVMMMPDTAADVLPDTVRQAEALGTKEPGVQEIGVTKSLLQPVCVNEAN